MQDEQGGQRPDLFWIEKRYRGLTFAGIGGFSGVMLLGNILKYEAWRQTGISLLLLVLVAAAVWGVFGYARIAGNRGGYMYGQQRNLAILCCAIPALVLVILALLAFVL